MHEISYLGKDYNLILVIYTVLLRERQPHDLNFHLGSLVSFILLFLSCFFLRSRKKEIGKEKEGETKKVKKKKKKKKKKTKKKTKKKEKKKKN